MRNCAYTPLDYSHFIDVPLQCDAPSARRHNNFQGPVPGHLTRAQISYIPEAAPGDVALDLGCGHGIHRRVIEALGYRYHGVDFSGDAAQHLVDAHALPYADAQYALVLSVAVLEHLAQPLVALREAFRVLQYGGFFIGTVAFLEPFHDNSFFHFTHLGLWHALRSAGFSVGAIMPIHGWHAARAQIAMGVGARLPAWFSQLVTFPFSLAVEAYSLLGRLHARDAVRHRRALALARHAGAFFFVATKAPPEPRGI